MASNDGGAAKELKELRWGILGCGNISADFVQSLNCSKRPHRVVAVGARDLKRAEEFARRFGDAIQPYGDYGQLLANSEIDVVYIGVHNISKKDLAIRSLDAGKHVLMEKPMACLPSETQQIIDKAKAKGLFLMEGLWSRFFPAWQRVRQFIESGELGRPLHFHMNLGGRNPRFNVESCEITSLAIGIYNIGMAMFVFGDEVPQRVAITGELNDQGIEEWVHQTLFFKNGRHATLYSTYEYGSPWCAYLSFDNGIIQIPVFNWTAQHLIVTRYMYPNKDAVENIEYPLKDDPKKYNFRNSEGLHYEADHVFEQIAQGNQESPQMPWSTTMAVAEIVAQTRRELGSRLPVDGEVIGKPRATE